MKTKNILFILSFLFISSLGFSKCNEKLIDAIKKNNEVKMYALLKKGTKVNCKTTNGDSPLHLAVKKNDIKLLRQLLKGGKKSFITTDRFLLALPVVGLMAAIFLLIAILFGIFYSHKLAGPIYRIEKSILQVINGARNFRVKLRKKDEFKKLADTLNRLLEYVEHNTLSMIKIKNLLEDHDKSKDRKPLKEAQRIIESYLEDLHE